MLTSLLLFGVILSAGFHYGLGKDKLWDCNGGKSDGKGFGSVLDSQPNTNPYCSNSKCHITSEVNIGCSGGFISDKYDDMCVSELLWDPTGELKKRQLKCPPKTDDKLDKHYKVNACKDWDKEDGTIIRSCMCSGKNCNTMKKVNEMPSIANAKLVKKNKHKYVPPPKKENPLDKLPLDTEIEIGTGTKSSLITMSTMALMLGSMFFSLLMSVQG